VFPGILVQDRKTDIFHILRSGEREKEKLQERRRDKCHPVPGITQHCEVFNNERCLLLKMQA
jgi:hypothetical protein